MPNKSKFTFRVRLDPPPADQNEFQEVFDIVKHTTLKMYYNEIPHLKMSPLAFSLGVLDIMLEVNFVDPKVKRFLLALRNCHNRISWVKQVKKEKLKK